MNSHSETFEDHLAFHMEEIALRNPERNLGVENPAFSGSSEKDRDSITGWSSDSSVGTNDEADSENDGDDKESSALSNSKV